MFSIILTIFISFTAKAANVPKIMEQIKKNDPKIHSTQAILLAVEIAKVTKKYKIPYKIFTAILMQESKYTLSAVNCYKGMCRDYGISQINVRTIEHYKFCKDKLIKNLPYSIEAGAIVLKDIKRRFEKLDENWWSRYNSGTPEKRRQYEKLVSQYF
jgi:hypothetical protein